MLLPVFALLTCGCLGVPLHDLVRKVSVRGTCQTQNVECTHSQTTKYATADCRVLECLKDDVACCKRLCSAAGVECTGKLRQKSTYDADLCEKCDRNDLQCCEKKTCGVHDDDFCPALSTRQSRKPSPSNKPCIVCDHSECCRLGFAWLELRPSATRAPSCESFTVHQTTKDAVKDVRYHYVTIKFDEAGYTENSLGKFDLDPPPTEDDISVEFLREMNKAVVGEGAVLTYYHSPSKGILKFGTGDDGDDIAGILKKELGRGVGKAISFFNLNDVTITACKVAALGLNAAHKKNIGTIEEAWRAKYRTWATEDRDNAYQNKRAAIAPDGNYDEVIAAAIASAKVDYDEARAI